MKKNVRRITLFLLCFLMTATAVSQKKTVVHAEEGTAMYRLYNPNSGEHFYTGVAKERNTLIAIGWRDEGIGWVAPLTSAVPVYRLYNAVGGEHHYTVSVKERDALVEAGWKDEGIGWYSYEGEDVKEEDQIPLYRQYNPNAFANNHNYTADTKERDTLLGLGWRDENTAWYGITMDLVWDGSTLTAEKGKIMGPSGYETWYNLDMQVCVKYMQKLGYQGEYSVREDGVKMFGDYVMVAADPDTRPLGTLVQTSLGTGIVVDTGDFVKEDPEQIDIATDWKTEDS